MCGLNNPVLKLSLVFSPLVEHLESIYLFKNTGNGTSHTSQSWVCSDLLLHLSASGVWHRVGTWTRWEVLMCFRAAGHEG